MSDELLDQDTPTTDPSITEPTTDASDPNTEPDETTEETDSTVLPQATDLPKLIIHNEDQVFKYPFRPYKYLNCFTAGECCYKRFTMPEGYVAEESIKSDFAE